VAEIGQRGKIIDRPSIHRTGAPNYQEGSETISAVVVNPLLESFNVNPMTAVCRDLPQRIASHAGDIHRLGDALSIATANLSKSALESGYDSEPVEAG